MEYTSRVRTVEQKNEFVCQVELENHCVINYVNTNYKLNVDDAVFVKINTNPINKKTHTSNYIMNGYVYNIEDGYTYISCGGLTCKVNKHFDKGQFLQIQMETKRKRSRTK